jgi:hypothetical protein
MDFPGYAARPAQFDRTVFEIPGQAADQKQRLSHFHSQFCGITGAGGDGLEAFLCAADGDAPAFGIEPVDIVRE